MSVCLPQVQAAGTGALTLPAAGTLVPLSKPERPVLLRGIKVRPEHPYALSFLVESGSQTTLVGRAEARRLVAYFLAALTIPKEDLWVNLSPYEQERIIPEGFASTLMGRDMLAQDYLLKQVAASVMSPDGDSGRIFWSKVYAEARKRLGNDAVPVDTRHKVWILPDKAVVRENAAQGAAFVQESSLKVMLEEDYVAIAHSALKGKRGKAHDPRFTRIAREVIIPLLTEEVNRGKNFARLRQVYSALILAVWYRQKVRGSVLNATYSGQGRTEGIRDADPRVREAIYHRYLQSFKKGVYNYVREEVDPGSGQILPRRYFSGGVVFSDLAMTVHDGAKSSISLHESVHHYHAVNAFLQRRARNSSPEQKGSLFRQIDLQLRYVKKVIRALRASRSVRRPVPPSDRVQARVFHQLWDPLTELLDRYTHNPNYSRESLTARYNTRLMQTMLTLIGEDIAHEDSLIVPTLRLVADWLRAAPSDPRVAAVRTLIDDICGIHLYNAKYDPSKPTVLFVRGVMVGVAATFDMEFKLLERDYNIAYFEYDEMKPIEGTARLLAAEMERYTARYSTPIKAAVLYSHGNTLFRQALREYAAQNNGAVDLFKGMSVVEMAPPLGGSKEAELLKYRLVRLFGARIVLRIQYHLANAYNPDGKIQRELASEEFRALYQKTVQARLAVMPGSDQHNPPPRPQWDDPFFRNFARLLEGARIVMISPADHRTVLHKEAALKSVTDFLSHRLTETAEREAALDRVAVPEAQPTGGIDFNTDHVGLRVEGADGVPTSGFDVPVGDQVPGFAGLAPVILDITPHVSPSVFLGMGGEQSSPKRP